MNGTGSNGWAAVGKPKADCGGSSPVEVRCDGSSDSDGGQNTQSLHERLGSGGDWEGDLDGGGHASHNDVEAAELAARQEPSWFTLPSNCRGMTPVAFMCLILVRCCDMLKILTTFCHRHTSDLCHLPCLTWRLDNSEMRS